MTKEEFLEAFEKDVKKISDICQEADCCDCKWFPKGLKGSTIACQTFLYGEYLYEQGYRKKIGNGTLIELPCKAGDEIYFVSEYYGRIFKGKVEFFTCSEAIEYIYAQYPETTITAHEVADIGNEVFFNCEEAEKKLAELKGEEE